jgi:hypothetical protein
MMNDTLLMLKQLHLHFNSLEAHTRSMQKAALMIAGFKCSTRHGMAQHIQNQCRFLFLLSTARPCTRSIYGHVLHPLLFFLLFFLSIYSLPSII